MYGTISKISKSERKSDQIINSDPEELDELLEEIIIEDQEPISQEVINEFFQNMNAQNQNNIKVNQNGNTEEFIFVVQMPSKKNF